MTKSRIDHTNCPHGATPADRKRCRDARRNDIREAQRMYDNTQLNGTGFDEYEATIDLMAGRFGVSMTEMFNIVERGPAM